MKTFLNDADAFQLPLGAAGLKKSKLRRLFRSGAETKDIRAGRLFDLQEGAVRPQDQPIRHLDIGHHGHPGLGADGLGIAIIGGGLNCLVFDGGDHLEQGFCGVVLDKVSLDLDDKGFHIQELAERIAQAFREFGVEE